jgi:hypothetical protein
MATRVDAVKATFRPIKNSELKPIAEIYEGLITATGVLAVFTAQDAGVNGAWVTNFGNSITAVGNIVPSKTIILLNKDITKSIKDKSKKSVKYGKVLTYFVEKAFAGQPGLIASFRVVEVNEKMRLGETEGMLYELNTLIQQVTVPANNAALVAAGWPVSNLADYETLRTEVGTLNTQQELAKKLVPENTDAAMMVRNQCYTYIQTLLTLKDIVYYEDKQKRHSWALTTNLNQIRSGGGGGGETIIVEGIVNMGMVANVSLAGIDGKTFTKARFEAFGGTLRYYASEGPINLPNSPVVDVNAGSPVNKTKAQVISDLGFNEAKSFLNVQHISGAGVPQWKVTFFEVKDEG